MGLIPAGSYTRAGGIRLRKCAINSQCEQCCDCINHSILDGDGVISPRRSRLVALLMVAVFYEGCYHGL